MADNNIDEFNIYVAKIFDLLYANFPKQISFTPYDITGKVTIADNEIFDGTMKFLQREGFINYMDMSTFREYAYRKVVLSSLGLSVLNAVPQSLEIKEKFIQKIKAAIKTGSKEAISATIQGVIQAAIAS